MERMPNERVLLYVSDSNVCQALDETILSPVGYQVVRVTSRKALERECQVRLPDAVLVGEEVFDEDEGKPVDGLSLVSSLAQRRPSLSLVVVARQGTTLGALEIVRHGAVDCLLTPLDAKEALLVVQRAVLRRQQLANWARLEVRRTTSSLQERVASTESERKKLETLLAEIQDGVIVIDLAGQLVLVNRAARLAFAVDGEGWFGKPLSEAIHHPDLLELLGDEHAAEPFRGEIGLEDGRVLNAQVTRIPEIGLVVSMQDITHLKELDRIKSDFVNTVSHDLRSPLTAILGYVELIERVGPVTDQQAEFIQRIQTSVQSITALINDLLDLGRIEAGFDVGKESVPLATLILFTVDSLRARIEEKSLRLELEVPQDLPHIYGNPVRLRQMLSNLIGNAVKFTPEHGEISVRAQVEGKQVFLRVHDSGLGIPAAEQPYVFDRFYRASNVRSKIPGTGLGLAIVKSIVENHHGRVWLESDPGSGTTFTVILPVLEKEG